MKNTTRRLALASSASRWLSADRLEKLAVVTRLALWGEGQPVPFISTKAGSR